MWVVSKVLTDGERVLATYPCEEHPSRWKAKRRCRALNRDFSVKRSNFTAFFEVKRVSKDL